MQKTTARAWGIAAAVPAGVLIVLYLCRSIAVGDVTALAWLGWFAAFGFIEWRGLRDARPGGTLSEVFWVFRWERGAGRWCHLRTVAIWLGLLGLGIHLALG